MSLNYRPSFVILAAALLLASSDSTMRAQEKPQNAKSVRCSFPVNATGNWTKNGSPEAVVKTATLVLRFDSINTDEGTAELRNGSVGSDLIVRLSGGNLHFMQSFRTGALYSTTMFDKETTGGKLKAVHSRHEYFNVPLEGSTSSPEQYYGECEIVN